MKRIWNFVGKLGCGAFAVFGGGVALLLAVFALAFLFPAAFFRAYLVAFVFWLGLALGCLAILMLHHMSGGRWGAVMLRILEAGSRTMAALTVLGLPLYLGIPTLFAWANPAERALLAPSKDVYLNLPFFIARTILYFVIWNGLVYVMNRWSAARDAAGDPRYNERLRRGGAVGIVIFGLTVTFAAIDWLMSLEPDWYSTIYAAMVAIGGVLSGFALAVLVTALQSRKEPLSQVVTPALLNDLGSLLLAFVMLWGYLTFSQLLLIWMGNLVEEIPWYLKRLNGGWDLLAILVGVFYFVLPFALLIVARIKRNAWTLAAIAGMLVVTRYLEVYWLIMPVFSPVLTVNVIDVLAVVGMGAVWLTLFAYELRKAPLVSTADPALTTARRGAPEAPVPRGLS